MRLLDIVKFGMRARRSNDPYVRGFNDRYNPFKPMKDYISGYAALKTTEPLVEHTA